MKLKINRTETTEVEIQLPHFRKAGAHFYKIYSDEKCIQVCFLKGGESVEVAHSGLAWSNTEGEECTEKEFIDAFNRVSDIIRHKAGTTPEQEKQEKREEKAGHYLCPEGGLSIEEQIKLIEQAHEQSPEERIYLDDIDGVDVWAQVENRITAADFLAIINS